MYHLFTRMSDGVWVNRWSDDSLQAVKVYADQYWPHAACQIHRHEFGGGDFVTKRSARAEAGS